EVDQPTARRFDRPSDVQRNTERVAVEATALVALRHVWKAMRCFKRELLEDLGNGDTRLDYFHGAIRGCRCGGKVECHHRIPTNLWVCRLSFHCGCARQYSSASCVFRTTSGPSIGCR